MKQETHPLPEFHTSTSSTVKVYLQDLSVHYSAHITFKVGLHHFSLINICVETLLMLQNWQETIMLLGVGNSPPIFVFFALCEHIH